MIFNCLICGHPVHLRRPDDKPLPVEYQVCYKCELRKEGKETRSKLGYSRIGLRNV
jgi:transcription elongation factor Elf1